MNLPDKGVYSSTFNEKESIDTLPDRSAITQEMTDTINNNRSPGITLLSPMNKRYHYLLDDVRRAIPRLRTCLCVFRPGSGAD